MYSSTVGVPRRFCRRWLLIPFVFTVVAHQGFTPVCACTRRLPLQMSSSLLDGMGPAAFPSDATQARAIGQTKLASLVGRSRAPRSHHSPPRDPSSAGGTKGLAAAGRHDCESDSDFDASSDSEDADFVITLPGGHTAHLNRPRAHLTTMDASDGACLGTPESASDVLGMSGTMLGDMLAVPSSSTVVRAPAALQLSAPGGDSFFSPLLAHAEEVRTPTALSRHDRGGGEPLSPASATRRMKQRAKLRAIGGGLLVGHNAAIRLLPTFEAFGVELRKAFHAAAVESSSTGFVLDRNRISTPDATSTLAPNGASTSSAPPVARAVTKSQAIDILARFVVQTPSGLASLSTLKPSSLRKRLGEIYDAANTKGLQRLSIDDILEHVLQCSMHGHVGNLLEAIPPYAAAGSCYLKYLDEVNFGRFCPELHVTLTAGRAIGMVDTASLMTRSLPYPGEGAPAPSSSSSNSSPSSSTASRGGAKAGSYAPSAPNGNAAAAVGASSSTSNSHTANNSHKSVGGTAVGGGRQHSRSSTGKPCVYSVDYVPQLNAIAVAGIHVAIHFICCEKSILLFSIPLQEPCTQLAYDRSSNLLLTTNRYFSVTPYVVPQHRYTDHRVERGIVTQHHTDFVSHIVPLGGGGLVATASLDRSVVVMDATSGVALTRFVGHATAVLTMCFVPQMAYMVSSGSEKEPLVWMLSALSTRADCFRLADAETPHTDLITGLANVPGTPLLASLDRSGAVKIWDLRSFRCSQTLRVDRQNIGGNHHHGTTTGNRSTHKGGDAGNNEAGGFAKRAEKALPSVWHTLIYDTSSKCFCVLSSRRLQLFKRYSAEDRAQEMEAGAGSALSLVAASDAVFVPGTGTAPAGTRGGDAPNSGGNNHPSLDGAPSASSKSVSAALGTAADDFLLVGIDINPVTHTIITASEKKVKIWDVFTGHMETRFDHLPTMLLDASRISAVCVSDSGRLFFLGYRSGRLTAHAYSTGVVVFELITDGGGPEITAMLAMRGTGAFVVTSWDRSLIYYDKLPAIGGVDVTLSSATQASHGANNNNKNSGGLSTLVETFFPERAKAHVARAVHYDSMLGLFCVGYRTGGFALFESRRDRFTFESVRTVANCSAPGSADIEVVHILQGFPIVAVADCDGKITLFTTPPHPFPDRPIGAVCMQPGRSVTHLAFFTPSKLLYFADDTGAIGVMDVSAALNSVNVRTACVNWRQLMLTAGRAGTAPRWVEELSVSKVVQAHRDVLLSLRLVPNSSSLVTASVDRSTLVWSLSLTLRGELDAEQPSGKYAAPVSGPPRHIELLRSIALTGEDPQSSDAGFLGGHLGGSPSTSGRWSDAMLQRDLDDHPPGDDSHLLPQKLHLSIDGGGNAAAAVVAAAPAAQVSVTTNRYAKVSDAHLVHPDTVAAPGALHDEEAASTRTTSAMATLLFDSAKDQTLLPTAKHFGSVEEVTVPVQKRRDAGSPRSAVEGAADAYRRQPMSPHRDRDAQHTPSPAAPSLRSRPAGVEMATYLTRPPTADERSVSCGMATGQLPSHLPNWGAGDGRAAILSRGGTMSVGGMGNEEGSTTSFAVRAPQLGALASCNSTGVEFHTLLTMTPSTPLRAKRTIVQRHPAYHSSTHHTDRGNDADAEEEEQQQRGGVPFVVTMDHPTSVQARDQREYELRRLKDAKDKADAARAAQAEAEAMAAARDREVLEDRALQAQLALVDVAGDAPQTAFQSITDRGGAALRPSTDAQPGALLSRTEAGAKVVAAISQVAPTGGATPWAVGSTHTNRTVASSTVVFKPNQPALHQQAFSPPTDGVSYSSAPPSHSPPKLEAQPAVVRRLLGRTVGSRQASRQRKRHHGGSGGRSTSPSTKSTTPGSRQQPMRRGTPASREHSLIGSVLGTQEEVSRIVQRGLSQMLPSQLLDVMRLAHNSEKKRRAVLPHAAEAGGVGGKRWTTSADADHYDGGRRSQALIAVSVDVPMETRNDPLPYGPSNPPFAEGDGIGSATTVLSLTDAEYDAKLSQMLTQRMMATSGRMASTDVVAFDVDRTQAVTSTTTRRRLLLAPAEAAAAGALRSTIPVQRSHSSLFPDSHDRLPAYYPQPISPGPGGAQVDANEGAPACFTPAPLPGQYDTFVGNARVLPPKTAAAGATNATLAARNDANWASNALRQQQRQRHHHHHPSNPGAGSRASELKSFEVIELPPLGMSPTAPDDGATNAMTFLDGLDGSRTATAEEAPRRVDRRHRPPLSADVSAAAAGDPDEDASFFGTRPPPPPSVVPAEGPSRREATRSPLFGGLPVRSTQATAAAVAPATRAGRPRRTLPPVLAAQGSVGFTSFGIRSIPLAVTNPSTTTK